MNLQKNYSKNYKIPQILIIEDDESLEDIWRDIILTVDKKAHVMWAKNAQEAEEKIHEVLSCGGNFDLVLTDINLNSSKNGIDLWREYNEACGKHMVLVSGRSCDNVEQILKKEESPLFIEKPLNLELCFELVYRVLHATA